MPHDLVSVDFFFLLRFFYIKTVPSLPNCLSFKSGKLSEMTEGYSSLEKLLQLQAVGNAFSNLHSVVPVHDL